MRPKFDLYVALAYLGIQIVVPAEERPIEDLSGVVVPALRDEYGLVNRQLVLLEGGSRVSPIPITPDLSCSSPVKPAFINGLGRHTSQEGG